jgi:hypothetical protein
MNSKNQYLVLFSGKDWYSRLSSAEIQNVIDQSMGWFQELMSSGKAKAAQALGRSGATISGKDGRILSDGPFAESKEAIGGYLLLEVGSLEEAIAIARTSPSLRYGSTVEVRPLLDECPLQSRIKEMQSESQLAQAAA